MIPYVKDKTLARRKTVIHANNRRVEVAATSRHPSGTVQCDWVLDFSHCTEEQILDMAKSSAVIRQQARFEKLPVSDLEAACHGTVDVSTLFERGPRTPVDPTMAAMSAWKRMSREEQIAFLAANGIAGEPA